MGLIATSLEQGICALDRASKPLLVVHCGTHKTASSYLQNRLECNSRLLAQQGIHSAWPGRPGHKHKGLVKAMLKGKTRPWESYLASASPGSRQCVVTAEQFTPAITEPQHLSFLEGIAHSHGMALLLVFFLRDQPDLINSMYAHTVRRLYHHHDFATYVRRGLRQGKWFVNYHKWLAAVREHSCIQLLLLPYHFHLNNFSANTDPFYQMACALGWQTPDQGWQPASRKHINTQVGMKGILLAQQVSRELSARGINPRFLRNTGGVIRAIAEREGWPQDRFQGFEPAAYRDLRQSLHASNDQLAQAAWGVPWDGAFPASPRDQAIAHAPENPQEARLMQACLEEALSQLLEQADVSGRSAGRGR
jgi:hypothetical protein